MANETLLEIVQTILNDMNGDEINSISDTAESEQVARIVKSVFMNMVSNTNWSYHRRATAITPVSDSNYPTHMIVNDNVKKLESVRYNKIKQGETRKVYLPVEYKEPDEFLNILNRRNNTATNVLTVTDYSGIELLILNDKAPDYYTSFDESSLVFDSYDSAVDTTLQESKVQAIGYIIPTFTISDSHVPDIPPDAFSYLVEEATSRCQFKLREFQDVKSETEAIKQGNWLSRQNRRVQGGTRYPNYGMRR